MFPVIAVDGPAGAGKSTLAHDLARALKIYHVDSGAFYRAVTYYALRHGFSEQGGRIFDDPAFFEGIAIEVAPYGHRIGPVTLEGEPVGERLRSWEVTQVVSAVSRHPKVRAFVNRQLRALAQRYPLVIDGRDIGTAVFPDAAVKFYVTCAPEVRARRRLQQMQGTKAPLPSEAEVLRNIIERDRIDASRAVDPLRKAPDAFEIDTTHLTRSEQLEKALEYIRRTAPELLNGADSPDAAE